MASVFHPLTIAIRLKLSLKLDHEVLPLYGRTIAIRLKLSLKLDHEVLPLYGRTVCGVLITIVGITGCVIIDWDSDATALAEFPAVAKSV